MRDVRIEFIWHWKRLWYLVMLELMRIYNIHHNTHKEGKNHELLHFGESIDPETRQDHNKTERMIEPIAIL